MKHEVDRVAREPVAGDSEARHLLALEDFEARPHDARQDDIGRKGIGARHRQDRRKPAVGDAEHKDDQPDSKDSKRKHRQALNELG